MMAAPSSNHATAAGQSPTDRPLLCPATIDSGSPQRIEWMGNKHSSHRGGQAKGKKLAHSIDTTRMVGNFATGQETGSDLDALESLIFMAHGNPEREQTIDNMASAIDRVRPN